MFFSQKALGLFLVACAFLVITACGSQTAKPILPPTVVASATTTFTPTPTPTPTSIPAIFPSLPEVGIESNGQIVVVPGKPGEWPKKVFLASTSVYVLLQCEGAEPVEVFVTLSLTGNPLPNYPLLFEHSCSGGTLLIISGSQAGYGIHWGTEGATMLAEVFIDSVVDMEAIEFVAGTGLGIKTKINLFANPEP